MLTANGAMPLDEHGHHHAFDAEVIEKNGSRNHVHNRIDGAHLVKMHFAHGKAVGFRLSLTQYGERLCGERPCGGRHAGGRDQGSNLREATVLVMMDMGAVAVMGMLAGMLGPMQVDHVVIVILVLGIKMHGEVEAGQPRLRHARDLDGKALNLQTVERIHHLGLRAPTIGRNVEQSRH